MRKLLSLAAAALLGLSASAQNGAPLYVCGSGDGLGWEPASPKEMTYANGTYTLQVNNLTSFKVSSSKGTWAQFNANAKGCQYQESNLGKPVSISAWGSNIDVPWTGNYTITINSAFTTLTLTTTTPKPTEATPLYFRGNMNGWGNSASDRTAWQWTYVKDVDGYSIYEFTCSASQSIAKGVSFKIADGNWGTLNFSAANIQLDKVTSCGYNGSDGSLAATWNGVAFIKCKPSDPAQVFFSNDKNAENPFLSEGPIDPTPGYAGWYLNVTGSNGNLADGQPFNSDGTAKVSNVAIGTGTFEIKIWDGKADAYYSTGAAVAAGEWVKLPSSGGVQMTVAGATADAVYDVEWNQDNTSVKLTLVSGGEGPIDPTPVYDGWYLNVIGSDGNLADGVAFNSDGTAKVSNVAIGTGTFEIKIWDGKADAYYSAGAAVAAGEWVKLPASGGVQMTVIGATADAVYDVEWNQENTSVKLTLVSGGEEPVVPTHTFSIVGSMQDIPYDEASGYEMTLVEGTSNVYSYTFDKALPEKAQFYIVEDKDWTLTFGAEERGFTLQKDVEANAIYKLANTYTLNQAYDKATVTFTFNGDDASVPSRVKIEESAVTPGNEYDGWYLNVIGTNGNLADGVAFNADGTAKVSNVAIGTGTFEVKIWDGKADAYYSAGAAVAAGEWVKLPASGGIQMTVIGATADAVYDVEWNQTNTSVKLTLISGGEEPVTTDVTVKFNNKNHKFEEVYVYLWKEENGSIQQNAAFPGVKMTKVEALESRAEGDEIWTYTATLPFEPTNVLFSNGTDTNKTDDFAFVNNKTYNEAGVQTGIETITADSNEEVFFYTLQGQRVLNPAAGGMYIRVQGNKATKIAL